MKKVLIYSTIVFSFLFIFKTPQAQWVLQTGGNLRSVYFINPQTGWACGFSGVIIKTTNGGLNWFSQVSNVGNDFYSTFFLNYNTGWVVGSTIILKTSNGGINWITIPPSGGTNNCVFFLNVNTGWICGGFATTELKKTTNGGVNWINQNSGLPITDLQSVVFKDENTGWIAGYGGVIKSTNGGNNWILCNTNSSNEVYFNDLNTGWSAGIDGIWKTTNGGNNWVQQLNESGYFLSINFCNSITGFAGRTLGRMFKTTNGGNNWILDATLGNDFIHSVCMPSSSVVYAAGQDGVYKKKVYNAKLNSIHKTVGRIMTNNIVLSDSLCEGIIDSVYWYINDSLVGRQHSLSYNYKHGTSFVKLKISNNSGQVDSAIALISVMVYKKFTNGQILAGESLISDSIFYAISTNNAVYRMDINGNLIYPLVTNGSILSECSISYDTCVYITSTDANLYGFKSDGSNIWPAIPLGGQASTTPTIDSASNRLYIGVANGFFRAINRLSGTSAWSYFCDAPVRSSAVLSSNRKLVVVSAIGTVYGFNLNSPSPSPPAWTLSLSDSIIVSPVIDSSGYFYFGSRSGKVYKISLTGTNTTSLIWQQPLGSPVTSSLVIDANNNIYAGTADGKLYCLNSGNGSIKWNFQTGNAIKSTPVITTRGRLYFGNDNGEVYGIDTNKNINFYFIDSAKVSCSMLYNKGTLYFGNESGRLYAFYDTTAGVDNKSPRGVPIWGTFQNNPRRTGNQKDGGISIGVQKISEIIPDKFELFQNYPNPFNPNTIIKFQIGRFKIGNNLPQQVYLKVYDVLGREVATLVNEKLIPGEYSINFKSDILSSGIYYYKLIAGNFEQVRKMVLLK